jgi:hypothetical protein
MVLMFTQTENVPRGSAVLEGHKLRLEDLTHMQMYCTDCLFRNDCKSASAIDKAIGQGTAPGSIDHLVYVKRPDLPDVEPKLICLIYENVTHAHR